MNIIIIRKSINITIVNIPKNGHMIILKFGFGDMGNSRPFDRRVSTCANKTKVLACTAEQAGRNLSKYTKIITHEQYNTLPKIFFFSNDR